jgi:hypothetical protein
MLSSVNSDHTFGIDVIWVASYWEFSIVTAESVNGG